MPMKTTVRPPRQKIIPAPVFLLPHGQKAYEVAAANREKSTRRTRPRGLPLKHPRRTSTPPKDEDGLARPSQMRQNRSRLSHQNPPAASSARRTSKEDHRLENDFMPMERHVIKPSAPKQCPPRRAHRHPALLARPLLNSRASKAGHRKALARESRPSHAHPTTPGKGPCTLAYILPVHRSSQTLGCLGRAAHHGSRKRKNAKRRSPHPRRLNAWLKEHADDARLCPNASHAPRTMRARPPRPQTPGTQSVWSPKTSPGRKSKLREHVIQNEKATAEADGAHTQCARPIFEGPEKKEKIRRRCPKRKRFGRFGSDQSERPQASRLAGMRKGSSFSSKLAADARD